MTLDIDSRAAPGNAEKEADIAVVYTPPRVAPQVLDLLWMVRVTILCHPAVARASAPGDVGTALATNDLLHVRLDGRPQSFLWETLRARRRGLGRAARPWPDLRYRGARGAICPVGRGVALVDTVLFQDEIAAGRLVQPFDLQVETGMAITSRSIPMISTGRKSRCSAAG